MRGSNQIARAAACVLAATSFACVQASGATAATLEASCENLQTRINEAATSGGADTVVLTGMCKSGATLPKEASFTLRGAPGTTSGFDGEGSKGPLLSTTATAGTMTIENLTFQRAKTTSTASAAGLDASLRQLTLRNDAFVEDTDESSSDASGGGAHVNIVESSGSSCQPGEPPALTVTGSTFRDDRAVTTGTAYVTQGGGLFAAIGCSGRTSTFADDVFEGDHAEARGSVQAEGLTAGGGVAVLSFAGKPSSTSPLQQAANVFDSNTVSGPTNADDGGGGEWLAGMSLASVGDRFSRNSIAGTTGSAWSWGGALGILGTQCNEMLTESTLEDAVVAANAIGAGTPEDLGGGGVYVGCEGVNTRSSNHLRLLDSTVTANSVATAGGVAGIDGHSQDQLAIGNSIVAGNVGGVQVGGFTGAGGALSSEFSDVCNEAGTAPLGGEGNICADPKLADDGDPSSYDVHETATSPTIDAGSNALVPSGLTSDFFGGPRIASGTSTGSCAGPIAGPATVDMGAAEAPAATRLTPLTAACPRPILPSTLPLPAISQGAYGELTASFGGLAAGTLNVLGTFKLTRTVTRRVHGHRRHVKVKETVTYCKTSLTTNGGNVKLALRPTRRALAILRSRHRLKVTLSITFTQPAHLATARTETLTIVYRAPKRRR